MTRVTEGWMRKKIMKRVAISLLHILRVLCQYLTRQKRKLKVAQIRGRKK